MKQWLLKDPGKRGSALGGVGLFVLRAMLPLAVLSYQHRIDGAGLEFIFFWSMAGFVWGFILGGGAAEAYAAAIGGNYQLARSYCLEFGFWSGGVCLAWAVLAAVFLYNRARGDMLWFAIALGMHAAQNFPLHAAALMLIAAVLLKHKVSEPKVPAEVQAPIPEADAR